MTLVRVEQFAEKVAMSPNTIYKLVSLHLPPEERLPHYRVPGAVRIDEDEGLAWMRERAMEDGDGA